jgi:hypothetical protein
MTRLIDIKPLRASWPFSQELPRSEARTTMSFGAATVNQGQYYVHNLAAKPLWIVSRLMHVIGY